MECGVTHRAFVGASRCEGQVGHSVGFRPESAGEPGGVCHVVVCRLVYQKDEDPIGSLCSLGGPMPIQKLHFATDTCRIGGGSRGRSGALGLRCVVGANPHFAELCRGGHSQPGEDVFRGDETHGNSHSWCYCAPHIE